MNAPAKINLIGREIELQALETCLAANKNILIEGPVGVGKTALATAVLKKMNRPFIRIDGDSQFTEQKLIGWYDPAIVMQRGYQEDAFIFGPLAKAMQAGNILFINELNRMPDAVQNALLPALDENQVGAPQYGEINATDGFHIIATQNPKDFVATSHLSEALLDRFELINLDYQSEADEIEIVKKNSHPMTGDILPPILEQIIRTAVTITRETRNDPQFNRGASIRAAISMTGLAVQLIRGRSTSEQAINRKKWDEWIEAIRQAAHLALPGRVEFPGSQAELTAHIDAYFSSLKKKHHAPN